MDGELDYSADRLGDWITGFTTVDSETNESYPWIDFDLTFGRYESDNDVYKQLGFSSTALPATMVVDREGKVRKTKEGKMHYADLKNIVLPLINETVDSE